ncbi:MAG TPA: hypothetical protein VFS83_12715 [Ktedonobacterales bacterium]|nr:hypothetical protein [Ktedonobacterales bacterium]
MSDTATDNVVPAGETEQALATATIRNAGAETLDVASVGGESPAAVGTAEGETAREVAAQHFARLMYTPISTWSRYVFHENDPHPFGSARRTGLRG